MIAVCIPSRGMCHSRTIDDLIKALKGYDYEFVFSHGRSQPDAQNYIVEEALKVRPDYILFCDDDMQIPEGIITEMMQKLIERQALICVAHYPCTAHGNDALHIRDENFESAGMGLVLMRPEVLEKLEWPYFRCDTQYLWNGEKLEASLVPPNHTPESIHGLHDVDFFQRLLSAGIEPVIADTYAGQYNLLETQFKKYGNYTQQNVETWRLP